MTRASYRAFRFWRPQLITGFAVLTVVVVVLLIMAAAGTSGAPPPWFLLLYAVALAWNAYWFGLRFSFRLDLDGDQLRWFGLVRQGECGLPELRQIRPQRWTGLVAVFEVANQPKVLVYVHKGFREFTEAVSSAAPDLPIRLSLTARMLGSRRFQRG